jgi:chromatin remodeling complex protein RSC6
MELLQNEIASMRSELKSLRKIVRQIREFQVDPDGTKAKERAKNNGFNRALGVTDALRKFLSLGADERISRAEVTRRINAYITEHGLKHPENGRVIILDEKLRKLLSPPSGTEVTFLNIQRYLSPHYVKDAPADKDAASTSTTPKKKRPVVKKKN